MSGGGRAVPPVEIHLSVGTRESGLRIRRDVADQLARVGIPSVRAGGAVCRRSCSRVVPGMRPFPAAQLEVNSAMRKARLQKRACSRRSRCRARRAPSRAVPACGECLRAASPARWEAVVVAQQQTDIVGVRPDHGDGLDRFAQRQRRHFRFFSSTIDLRAVSSAKPRCSGLSFCCKGSART